MTLTLFEDSGMYVYVMYIIYKMVYLIWIFLVKWIQICIIKQDLVQPGRD